MTDVSTAVVTGFVSAFTMFLAVVAFTGRQIRELKSDLRDEMREMKTELRMDVGRLDEKFERLMFELLRHVGDSGHEPPPQAA